MHVDHVIPSNMRECQDNQVKQYILELEESGFIIDSIENYLPSCPACNISKSNRTYTAANLRFFHEQARTHVDEILQKIASLKTETSESFYEPVDIEVWDEVHFSYQHDISYAIMGYRLTPADVEACPRFPQVERIIKQLEIVDYVILQGETGCGKSISIYQAAYDLYKKGWKVHQYKAAETLNVPLIPHNTDPSLYIIDDAQQLPEKTVEAIAEQARPNTKIIFAKTISSIIQDDTILLTNKDAVRILYEDFLARKEDIIPIVHQCDKEVGINSLDLPIERRLKEASKAETPWQFNYILRGGWQTMRERYQAICAHHNCDLLATAIALFQIMQLDSNINYNWLCSYLQHFDNSLYWDYDDLQYLVGQKIVLSTDNVRIVHMESAAVIIAQFLQNTSARKREVLRAVIEASFIEKRVTPLGLVWLCNGVQRHSIYRCKDTFINEEMISFVFESLENVQTSQERVGIAFFIEIVFTLHDQKNGYWHFRRCETLFLDWITHADSKTAYAYSRLINTLYNTNKKQHRQFARKIDWTQVIQSMMTEKNPDLYVWGELFNRLTISLSKRENMSIATVLQPAVDKLGSITNISSISNLTEFLCSISHICNIHVHETVRKLTPVYAEYFKKNMSQSIELFDFHFFLYICGMSLLGGHRATKEERKTAELIVATLPETEFAAVFSSSLPRDWQRIHEIMSLVRRYDLKKSKKIVALVDTIKLSDTAANCWNCVHEIADICVALHIGDPRIARRFIESNQDKIKIMYSPLAMIAPQCAIRVFRSGVSVDLLTGHWWTVSFYALRELINEDEVTAKEILIANTSAIIDQINDVHAIDFQDNSFLAFLQLVRLYYVDVFHKITGAIDVQWITDNWEKSYRNPRKKMQEEKRYYQFLEIIAH